MLTSLGRMPLAFCPARLLLLHCTHAPPANTHTHTQFAQYSAFWLANADASSSGNASIAAALKQADSDAPPADAIPAGVQPMDTVLDTAQMMALKVKKKPAAGTPQCSDPGGPLVPPSSPRIGTACSLTAPVDSATQAADIAAAAAAAALAPAPELQERRSSTAVVAQQALLVPAAGAASAQTVLFRKDSNDEYFEALSGDQHEQRQPSPAPASAPAAAAAQHPVLHSSLVLCRSPSPPAGGNKAQQAAQTSIKVLSCQSVASSNAAGAGASQGSAVQGGPQPAGAGAEPVAGARRILSSSGIAPLLQAVSRAALRSFGGGAKQPSCAGSSVGGGLSTDSELFSNSSTPTAAAGAPPTAWQQAAAPQSGRPARSYASVAAAATAAAPRPPRAAAWRR